MILLGIERILRCPSLIVTNTERVNVSFDIYCAIDLLLFFFYFDFDVSVLWFNIMRETNISNFKRVK